MISLEQLEAILSRAVNAEQLLEQSRTNIMELLHGAQNPAYLASVAELAEGAKWNELNDRFFKKLSFGTSGLRGRTVGSIVTTVEQGKGGPNDRPELPC
ncbi:MAG: phospho-sugar mutase, partial [Verrucomicrobiales bacterium]|nr:phospho-sugar mutase [Verrucomicrobiales bacterium]